MTSVINAINHLILTFQKVTVPTASNADNSNLVANSLHTRNYMSSIGKIFADGFAYTISSVKTMPFLIVSGHTLTEGIGTTASTSIGTSLSTQNNIGTATTPAIYLGGSLLKLLPAGTNGYSIPAISGSNNSKIQAGVVTASDTGTTVIYPVTFTGAPHIVANSRGATPKLVTIYQPSGVSTSQGFGIACQGGGDVNWLACGPR